MLQPIGGAAAQVYLAAMSGMALDMPVLGMGWFGTSVSLIGDAISLSYQVGIRRLTHAFGRVSPK